MMFPEESVSLYKSIKAPETLYGKVLEKTQTASASEPGKAQRKWNPILTAAACLVLVLVSAIPSLFGSESIIVDGTPLGDTPVLVISSEGAPAPVAKASFSPVEIRLELQNVNAGDVDVSHGEISKESEDSLLWTIPPEDLTQEPVTLSISATQTTYSLFCDDAGNWYLQKSNK